MKPFIVALPALFLAVEGLQAQPTIAAAGVVNVASYTPSALPGGSIAQGSLFVIFGSNMGPAALISAPSLPLTTTLGGTSLTVTIGGNAVKPFLVYTSAGQIGALMPSGTPVGAGTLTATYNGQTSVTTPVTVAASSVGIFSLNQAGSGPGIITTANYAVNTITTAASPGDVNIIWATGLGPTSSTGSEAAGTAPIAALPSAFKVYVGGVSATIVGAARSSLPGLDQIAFTVPAGVAGCHVPVVVQTGTVVSNFVSMAIGAGGVCSDPGVGLTPSQLTLLQQKGTVSQGIISLGRIAVAVGVINQTVTTDLGVASFSNYTFPQYTVATGRVSVPTGGACSVSHVIGSPGPVADPIVSTPLDEGAPLTVTGPGGTKTLTEVSTGGYSTTLGSGSSLYLSPGTYTISGPGGKDVGAISASITLPPALTWTNAAAISNVNRANGQLITWTGGDPAGTTEISGSSSTGSGGSFYSALFSCTVPTSAQQFTIPSFVLLSLPPSLPFGVSGPQGILEVGAAAVPTSFSAAGLDFGYLTAVATANQTVIYQ